MGTYEDMAHDGGEAYGTEGNRQLAQQAEDMHRQDMEDEENRMIDDEQQQAQFDEAMEEARLADVEPPMSTPSNENTCPRCGKAGDNKTLRGRVVYPCGSRRYTAGVFVESVECLDHQSKVMAIMRKEMVESNTQLAAAKAENERLKESEGQLSRELGFVRDANAEDLAELTTELTTLKAVLAQVKALPRQLWADGFSDQPFVDAKALDSLLTSTPNALAVVEGYLFPHRDGGSFIEERSSVEVDTNEPVTIVALPRSGGSDMVDRLHNTWFKCKECGAPHVDDYDIDLPCAQCISDEKDDRIAQLEADLKAKSGEVERLDEGWKESIICTEAAEAKLKILEGYNIIELKSSRDSAVRALGQAYCLFTGTGNWNEEDESTLFNKDESEAIVSTLDQPETDGRCSHCNAPLSEVLGCRACDARVSVDQPGEQASCAGCDDVGCHDHPDGSGVGAPSCGRLQPTETKGSGS